MQCSPNVSPSRSCDESFESFGQSGSLCKVHEEDFGDASAEDKDSDEKEEEPGHENETSAGGITRKRSREDDDEQDSGCESQDPSQKRQRTEIDKPPAATWEPVKPGMGRGRSLTLPAWMTSGGNAAQDIVVKTSESTENAPVDGVKIESNSDAGGRGLIQSGAAVDVTHKALGRGEVASALYQLGLRSQTWVQNKLLLS